MPLAATDDAELTREIKAMAAAGAGGVEIQPFAVSGAGNNTAPALEQFGFGTEEWAHKVKTIATEGKKAGLIVDQTIGARWPPVVPTVDNFNQPAAAKQIIFGAEFNQPGTSRSGALPATTTAVPTVTTALCQATTSDADTLKVRSIAGLAQGDDLTVGSGANAEHVQVVEVGRASACTTLFAPTTAGASNIKVAAVANFHVGDTIRIGAGSSAETATVSAVETPAATTTLAAAAAVGATNIKLAATSGITAGDRITIDTGGTPETVKVTAVSSQGATGGGVNIATPLTSAHASGAAVSDPAGGITLTAPLSNAHAAAEDVMVANASGVTVTPSLTQTHAASEGVVDTAKKSLIAVTIAQCAAECSAATSTTPRKLVQSSVKNVTDLVDADGNLSYSFPQGNGNPWVVTPFYMTADGQTQAGYTPTTPNYVTDHLTATGAKALTDFYDSAILNDAETRKALFDNPAGPSAFFEDSLELGNGQKWTTDFLSKFKELRGYDPTLDLPVMVNLGAWNYANQNLTYDRAKTPYFDFDTTEGNRIRWDYAQTWSDLFTSRYLKELNDWAESYGGLLRFQVHGEPIDGAYASSLTGIPEGEGLEFNDNTKEPLDQYKLYAAGAALGGKSVVSCECVAISGQVWNTTAYSELALHQAASFGSSVLQDRQSINGMFAGGANQVVWHGYAYQTQPQGTGVTSLWPGFSYGGNTSYSEAHGTENPKWKDEKKVNDYISRLSLTLRQGESIFDVGVYSEELGTAGQAAYRPNGMIYTSTSALNKAGYTYSYLSPEFLDDETATYSHGLLFGGKLNEKAIVLADQPQIRLDAAQKLLALAKSGAPMVIIGTKDASSITAPGGSHDKDADIAATMGELYALAGTSGSKVVRVATEADVPAALRGLGISAAAEHTSDPSSTAIVANHRAEQGRDYYYLYNQTGAKVSQSVTLEGDGIPYLLDPWSGDIEPIAQYTQQDGKVTVDVSIAGYDNKVIALATQPFDAGATAPTAHAVSTTADSVDYGHGATGDTLEVRADSNGEYTTTLAGGAEVKTTIDAVKSATVTPASWQLSVDSWTAGASGLPGDTAHTTLGPVTVTPKDDGTLPAWSSITPANGYGVDLQDVSGIGTYTASITLPEDWDARDGAYISLGKVVDTSVLKVNGKTLPPVDYVDLSDIDLGPYLEAGQNSIEITVASTLINAVRANPLTGASTRARADYGLIGPVTTSVYRSAEVATPAAPAQLSNTAAPRISGAVKVASTVTATSGQWSTPPEAYAYQWLLGGRAIAGATRSTYTIPASAAGKALSVRVTATSGDQTARATSAARVVARGTFRLIAAPHITGKGKVGRKLHVDPGSWSPRPGAIGYQWLRNGKVIKGATSGTYKARKADAGKRLRVRVTVSAAGYAASSTTTARVVVKKK